MMKSVPIVLTSKGLSKMDFRITLVFLIIGFNAWAGQLEDQLSKLSKAIENDKSARFCVASIPKGEYKNNSRLFPTTAVCIGNLVFFKGTMKERSGCTAYIINGNNLMKSPLLANYDYNMAVGKSCGSGGFEEVIADLLLTDNTGGKPVKVLVESAFSSPYRLPDNDFDLQIVYNEKSTSEKLLGQPTKYETWFNKIRTEYLAKLNAKK